MSTYVRWLCLDRLDWLILEEALKNASFSLQQSLIEKIMNLRWDCASREEFSLKDEWSFLSEEDQSYYLSLLELPSEYSKPVQCEEDVMGALVVVGKEWQREPTLGKDNIREVEVDSEKDFCEEGYSYNYWRQQVLL